jgi:hypothetical protein
MSAAREKDGADFDLERFTEMFDRAMTSSDPRVKNALRQLMMMVILTDEGDHEAKVRAHGPLRRMQEDLREQFRWIKKLEQEIESLKRQMASTHGLGGYRSEGLPRDYDIKYADNTRQAIPGALPSTDYWNQVVAQTNAQKINGGLLPKEKK